MNKNIILSLLFTFCINPLLFAQELQKINGNITALYDTIAIPYAHIGILGSGIGTVSNINGDFQIKGHFDLQKDSLIISHIEYEKQHIPLTELLADTNHIQLNRNEYILADVIIMPEEQKNNIIKNLKKNYSDKLYQSEAFYREVQYDDKTETYSRLVEAALNIQDGKITAPISKIKCSILQFRKSDNYTNEHWGSRMLKKFLNMPNGLHIILRDNSLRSYKSSNSTGLYNHLRFIYKQSLDNLRLLGTIHKNEEDIYVFQYSYNEKTSCFYVNKNNYAVLQYDNEFRTKTSLVYKYSYHFRRIDEKYYPSFFSYTAISGIRSNSEGLGMTDISLTFVDYHLDKKTFKRLRRKHVLPKDIDLYDQEVVYDETFWANYNILLEEPLDYKVESDLEKEESLSTQFKKNAKTNP